MSEQLAASVRIVRRHWLVITLIPLLAIAASVGVSAKATKKYTATAKVYIAPSNEVSSLIAPGSQPTPADPERDLNTEVSQITETPMADLVRGSLHLSETPADLLSQVSAELEGTTNIVDIAVTDPSPSRAASIANAFASQYVGFNLTFQRRSFESSLATVDSRLSGLTAAELAGPTGQQLTKEKVELEGAIDVLSSSATVNQTAAVPTSPSSPKPLLDAVIAAVVGLLVAIVVAIVMELFDKSVRTADDAAAAARLPSIGVIPRPRPRVSPNRQPRTRGPSVATYQRAGGAPAAPHSRAAASDWETDESYSSLAITLLSLRLGQGENVLMITSAGPQDGKTSVTLGVAAALAALGRRVVAVECDLRRPRFADYLRLPPSREGLSSILAGNSALPAGLVQVGAGGPHPVDAKAPARSRSAKRVPASVALGDPQFTVLPAGPIPTRPLALLGGGALPPLLRELQSTADVLLLDTPPLGVIKDAAVLASMVDQIVLVARVGHTRRDALARTRAAIDQLGTPLAGIVSVGGPRGGELSYYGRTDAEVRLGARTLPEPAAAPKPPPEEPPTAEPEPEPQAASSPTADAKRNSRRRSSPRTVG